MAFTNVPRHDVALHQTLPATDHSLLQVWPDSSPCRPPVLWSADMKPPVSDTPKMDPNEGTSLALLGHDLRAVLGEMRSSLYVVSNTDAPPHLRDMLDRCRAVSDTLSRIVDQSVMVCLGQGSPLRTGPVEVHTADFLTGLRQRWSGRCAETGHHFHLVAAGELPTSFHIDRTALDRVLANLISNCINHAPPGAINLTFKISGGDLLLIAVEDEGPGFPADHIAAIEANFALPAEARRPEGGLGLQSVKRLVEAMGGLCNARNKTSGGVEIGICLPLPHAPAGHMAKIGLAEPILPPQPDLTGTRLLFADDSPSSRELVDILARQIGATIHTVNDGTAAIAALQGGAALPDVVILDEEMPGASGLEVLKWLRASEGAKANLPVLALTCHIGREEVSALYEAGATEVLTKPVLCPLELGRAILRVKGAAVPVIATTQHSARHKADAPFDLSGLRRLSQIAGPLASAELFDRMQEDLADARFGLAHASATADIAAIRSHSHVIIALAGTAGAGSLHDDAVTLNGMTHSGDPNERIIALAERLDAAIGHLIEAVRDVADEVAEASGG